MKIWLSSPQVEGIFGDGKWRLLRAVKRESSLKAACAALNISYRKAWGDLRKAERWLCVALLERRRGGKAGGGTRLTAEGEKLLRAYTGFREEACEALEAAFEKHLSGLLSR